MRSISRRVKRIRASPIRKLTAMLEKALKYKDIISFGGGAPSLPPPQELREELKILAEKPETYKYGSTQGKLELRTAISEDLKSKGVDCPPEQIALTTGCTEAIFLSILALLDQGDEAVLTDPCYLGYPEPFKMFNNKISWLPLYDERDFQPQQEDVNEVISSKTKVVVIVSPDNPTGSVLTRESSKMLADAAVDNDCYILYDETYRDIIYDDAEHNFMFNLAPENTVGCFSFSKCASIPGLRLGLAYAPPEVIDAIEKLQQYTILCPNTLSQLLAMRFLEGNTYPDYVNDTVVPTYDRRKEAMGEAIKKYLPEAEFSPPHGAFYYFPDMTPYLGDRTEEEFCSWVLEQKKVALIPGNYFGNKRCLNHIRMTFVSETTERIEEGISKIGELVV